MALFLEFATETNNPAYVAVARSCQARLAMLQGDMASAERWLHTAELTGDDHVMIYFIELSRITQCRILTAQGTEASLRQAEVLLEKYRQQNESQHNIRQLVEILPL